ncbi:hypothetical protein HMPREF9628_01501 [Peptoanaerobacter stomatis]|uniref:Biotin transporter n=1 Tax=Peptoanaerobacter stomatis TaxID=796937 RepID=G9XCC4_9FIRM|nr:biotin transporter BioY [Peptoanaerobacter stomatis]EHL19421.1 hypothetical protein HMPREF9628_01501 [Peptoanaerobacter stomatis]
MQETKNISKKKFDTKAVVMCSLFSALVCVGAFIKVPLPPVPFTMQWFFVAMAGLVLGSNLGFTSVAVYLVLGLIGLPVFTQGGGISYIFKPTFGYLVGFAIAAFVIGKLSENKEKNFKNYFIANMIGLVIVYTLGFIHLYFVSTVIAGKTVALFNLLKGAVIIFIPTDTLSAILSAKVASRLPKIN